MVNRSRLRSGLVMALGTVTLACGAAAATAACEDSSTPASGLDSGAPPTTTTTPPPPVDAQPYDSGSPTIVVDSGAAGLIGCRKLLAENPATPTGVHAIDLDGTGPLPPLDLYCDMTFDGGGWTLIQSYTGAQTPADLPSTGEEDSGILVAAPRPATFGALAGWVVKTLAEKSSQVHVRNSFAADAAAADPDAGLWITSRPPTGAAATLPIQNLRNLVVMTNGTDGGFDDWTGPSANAARLSWVPGLAGCSDLVPTEKYPSVFWACGNYESMNIFKIQGGHCRWRWNDGAGVKEPMEVYIR